MGVLGKSRQGCVGMINNICALTDLLTSKAILMLPSTGLPTSLTSDELFLYLTNSFRN